jgi:hypothetical protein
MLGGSLGTRWQGLGWTILTPLSTYCIVFPLNLGLDCMKQRMLPIGSDLSCQEHQF